MNGGGKLIGIGVGSGEPGLISLVGYEWLRRAEVIYAPRARDAGVSMALRCLEGVEFDRGKLRESEFTMESDRGEALARYEALAGEICEEIARGKTVAYLTIGDPMTYSTYAYALASVRRRMPGAEVRTVPGVPSFCSAAAAAAWPLALGRERVLILPCPDDMGRLRAEIEAHDVVIVMKVGGRYAAVVALLREMGIAGRCAYARRVGLPEQLVVRGLDGAGATGGEEGYLALFLIRKGPAPGYDLGDAGRGETP